MGHRRVVLMVLVAALASCSRNEFVRENAPEPTTGVASTPGPDAAPGLDAASADAGPAKPVLHVRRLPGKLVDLVAMPWSNDLVGVLANDRPIGTSSPAWSWEVAQEEGTLLWSGELGVPVGSILSPLASRTLAVGYDVLEAPLPAGAVRTTPRVLRFAAPSASGLLPVASSIDLPVNLADGPHELGADDKYHEQCVSASPLYVYPKLGASEYVFTSRVVDGDVVVVSSSCGVARWQRVAQDGNIVAESSVASFASVPGTPDGLAFASLVRAVDVSADGHTAVVLAVRDGWDWAAVLDMLGLPNQPTTNNRFVTVYLDGAGHVLWRRALTFDDARRVKHVVLAGDVVHLAGEAMRAVERPSDTIETDLWVASFDASTGTLLRERILDIDADDLTDAVVADPRGGIIVGLRAGAVQVDTGSIVSFPDVVLVALDSNLEERGRLRFGSPRSDAVSRLSFTKAGRLLVSGQWDGPITHTDEAEWDFGGFWTSLPLDGWTSLSVTPAP